MEFVAKVNNQIEEIVKGSPSILSASYQKTQNKNRTNQAFISIIIPAYQEEKILGEMLELISPIVKNKRNYEIIISDGNSDDSTIDIARKYTDKIVIHQNNYRQTISEGRNNGAKVARGDVFVFINADTFPEDPVSFFEYIENWANGNEESSDAAALACYVTYLPNESIFKDRVFYFLHNNYVAFLNLVNLGMGRGECQIVRRWAFEAVNGYNQNIMAGEDFDLYRRISKRGKVRFIRSLRVCESPRRFRKYGYLRIVWQWSLNSLSVWFFGKSVSKEWEAVR
ncbi:MAG: glycosyltransferase [Candidatus Kapabacteria bacterium]|nr:glycosyltransferase [Candidatus Kapabacteria bacterium]